MANLFTPAARVRPTKLPTIKMGHNSTTFIDVDMSKGKWTKIRTIDGDQETVVKNTLWYRIKRFFHRG